MNLSTFTKRQISAKMFAGITIVSLLLTAFPVAFFVAQAANTDAVGTVILTVSPAPTGEATESVTVGYTGVGTLDLSGWTIEDTLASVVTRYTFGAITLTSGQEFQICGLAGCDDLISSGGNTIWNNNGDTAVLKDENGFVIVSTTYAAISPADDSVYSNSVAVNYVPTGTVRNVEDNQFFVTIQEAVDAATTANGETIELTADIVTTAEQVITKTVTLDGNGFTITPNFSTNGGNNSVLEVFDTDGVTIKDLIIDSGLGNTKKLHGINVYESDGLNLNDVTLLNNGKSGLVVNSSEVTVSDITTGGNAWHGINVDYVTEAATLTVVGQSTHTDNAHIYVDDRTEDVTVNDNETQYSITEGVAKPNDRLYTLKAKKNKKVDICHYHQNGFNFQNVAINSIGNAHGANGANDGDIIPVIPGVYAGQNLATDYNGVTGAELLANNCVAPKPVQTAPEVCSFAGEVVAITQNALKYNGQLVDGNRRTLTSLDSVAPYINFFGQEGNGWSTSDFLSLGVDGFVTYKFTDKVAIDGPGNDIAIWEVTGGKVAQQTNAKAVVEVSQDGVTFYNLGTIAGDGAVDIAPSGFSFVQYVRVTDDSRSIGAADGGDGYDVDAITIIEGSCDDYPIVVNPDPEDQNQLNISGEVYLDISANDCNNRTECLFSRTNDKLEGWEMRLYKEMNGVWSEVATATTNESGIYKFPTQYEAGVYHTCEVLEIGYEQGVGNWNGSGYLVNTANLSGAAEEGPYCNTYTYADTSDKSSKSHFGNAEIVNYVEYGPYCGDEEVNQDWEQCEADDESGTCNVATCQYENQCSELNLVKITLEETDSVSFNNMLYLGSASNPIPNGTWFNFDEAGDASAGSIANAVEGFGLERDQTNQELYLALRGGNGSGHIDRAHGTIEFMGVEVNVSGVNRTPNPQFKLENGSGGSFNDVFAITSSTTINFDLRADTGNDGVTVELVDVDMCKVPLEREPAIYTIDGSKYQLADAPVVLAGWTIELRDSEGELITSTTTDNNGYYFFDVLAGEYQVHEVMQQDWEQALVTQNGSSVDTEATVEHCSFNVNVERSSSYECEFTNQDVSGSDPTPLNDSSDNTDEGEGSTTGTQTNRFSFASASTGEVLGASTTNFCPFLEDFMQMGAQNDEMEVKKLQVFLNIFKGMFGGVENPVTGTFDTTTDANVKAFQEHFKTEILDPWYNLGIVPHNRPTGFVYKTTLWKINSIVCPDYAILPEFAGEDLNSNVDL